MKNVVANGPWPDLNPQPCPRLVWKSATGPGPSLCQRLRQPKSTEKGAVCWAFPGTCHLRGPGIGLSRPQPSASSSSAQHHCLPVVAFASSHPAESNQELSFSRSMCTRQGAGTQIFIFNFSFTNWAGKKKNHKNPLCSKRPQQNHKVKPQFSKSRQVHGYDRLKN